MFRVTNTTMQMFLTCEKKFYYNQIRGLFPIARSDSLKIGSLVHKALEIWANTSKEEAIKFIKDYSSDLFKENIHDPDFDTNKLIVQEAIVVGMIEGFPWPLLADRAEFEFHAPYRGFDLCGKVDGSYRKNGYSVIFDYKTKGALDRVDDEALLLRNHQASFYFNVLVRLLMYDYDLVEFFFLRRPSIRQKKNEGIDRFAERIIADYKARPDFYYLKSRTARNRDSEEWMRNFDMHLHNLRICYEKDVWPMRETSCSMFGKCPYLPICNKNDRWEMYYERLGFNQHPELEVKEDEPAIANQKNGA